MNILKKSKLNELVNELDERGEISSVSEWFFPLLEEKVHYLVKNAIKRAVANKRRRLLVRDL